MSIYPIRVREWAGAEQRRHKRILLRVPVECQSGRETIQGKAENISPNGLLIRATKTFAEDEEITLRFALPGIEQVIQCRAHVAHVVPDIFMGVEFLELSPKVIPLIEEFIAAALNKPEKPS
ncbi:MAG: PilZ domain-containing protein [Acidobacteria bacterium]|nr:PilZ domain-containing protein [Acidobacteriota bacterium]